MGGGPSHEKEDHVSRPEVPNEVGKSTQNPEVLPPPECPTPGSEAKTEAVGGEEPQRQQLVLPHDFDMVTKDADCSIDVSSAGSFYRQLRDGVYLNQSKKKYWIDNKSNNCFMFFPRSLSITWSENSHYWHWSAFQDTMESSVETVELLNVCWLEVRGYVDASRLTPGVTYSVFFVAMVRDHAYGWETPVNLRLKLPDGTAHENKVSFLGMARWRWTEIPVGGFQNDTDGVVEFSLYEYEDGSWKRGLVIKGAVVRPMLHEHMEV